MSGQVVSLTSPQCRVLSGKHAAADILHQVVLDVAELKISGFPLQLVSISFGDAGAVEIYIRNQKRAAAKAGIDFTEVSFDRLMEEQAVIAAIAALNADPAVTGIILQRPIPPHLSIKKLQGAIAPSKDVEGMHPESIGQIVYGSSDIGPCTALAAVELLRQTGLKIEGLEVVIIGHSEIVGKPIAFLLMAEGATVTVCHHLTRSVAMHARRADAVFVAVGKPRLIGPDMIKPGAALIDIGINPVTDDHGKSHVVGDVDADAVRDVAGWLTPVPGGVGPVTLSILMRNTVHAARRQRAGGTLKVSPSVDFRALDHVVVRDLDVSASIGVNPKERTGHQPVRINIDMETRRGGEGIGVVCYKEVVDRIHALLASGHIRLVEELADRIARECLDDQRVRSVRVRVEKLSAIPGAAGAGVEIQRSAA